MLRKNFKIDNYIYSKIFINHAIIDYENIAKITYNKWELTISWENNEEITEIFNEFMNYVLYLCNISN